MDKNKIIQAATKYMQRGQHDRAIAEYRKILKVDPDDVRVLLKIGEIQQKKGENIVAATTLFDVAKAYASDGFFLKAVAVYKQVLKLDPGRVDVSLLLSDLYQQLGLLSDAMSQLQAASAHYESKGETGKVLDVARKMLSVEPDDLGARIRVADLLHREGETAAALTELRQALASLNGDEGSDDFLKIGERIVALDPADGPLGRKLAATWLQRGDTRRALARLQTCFQQEPRHAETLDLLGSAFRGLSQSAKAVSVYKELAKVHREEGRRSDELAAWRKVAELAPADPDAAAALAPGSTGSRGEGYLPPPIPASAPSVQATTPPPFGSQPTRADGISPRAGVRSAGDGGPPVAGRVPSGGGARSQPPPGEAASVAPSRGPGQAAGDGGDTLSRLLTETDVFVKYGLVQKASDHLDKIFAIDPESIPAHEKAVEIQRGRHPAALAASLAALARLHARNGDFGKGRAFFEEFRSVAPTHPEAVALASLYTEASDEPLVLVPAAEESLIIEPMVAEESLIIDPMAAEESLIIEDLAEAEALVVEPLGLSADEPLVVDPILVAPAGLDPLDLAAADSLILDPIVEGDEPFGLDDVPAVAPMFAPDEPLLVPLDIDDEEQPVVLDGSWDEPVDPAWVGPSDDEALLDLAAESVGDEVVDPRLDGEGDDWLPGSPDPSVGQPGKTQGATATARNQAGADVGVGAPTRTAPAPDDPTLAAPAPEDRTRTLAPEQLLRLQAAEVDDATVELDFDASVEIDATSLQDASNELKEAAALVQAGHFEEAAVIYRGILERWPEHPDATERLGVLLAWRNIGQQRTEHHGSEPLPEVQAVDLDPGILPPEPDTGWEPVELEGMTFVDPTADPLSALADLDTAASPTAGRLPSGLADLEPAASLTAGRLPSGLVDLEPAASPAAGRFPSGLADQEPAASPTAGRLPSGLTDLDTAASPTAGRLPGEGSSATGTDWAKASPPSAAGVSPSGTGWSAAPMADDAIWKAPDPSDWASAGPDSTAGWMPDESSPFEFGSEAGALDGGFGEEGLFDLGAVLAEELAAEEASGGPGFGLGEFQYPADEVLEKFKEGVAQTVKPEDVNTHYNLAIAYREMGLFDDAIEAFEMARSGCVGEEKEVDCMVSIGLCHRSKGDERRAIEVFRDGLAVASSPDVEKALLYEIAQSLEAEGELNEALATYGLVARIDGSFRNVKQMIAKLVAGGAEVPSRASGTL